MQSETGFPSSHQLKSYVASKSRLKLAARAVLSADAGLLVPSTHTSRVVGMTDRIHVDMFFQDRCLLNEVHVKIKLVRTRNSFCLMWVDEFKVKIESGMFVKNVNLCPSVFLVHTKALENVTTKYPTDKSP